MKTINTATLTGYVGEPKANPFQEDKFQYSIKVKLDTGEEVWINANTDTPDGEFIKGLSQGATFKVASRKTPKGKTRYDIVGEAPGEAPKATPPPKKDKVAIVQAEFDKFGYILDKALLLVTEKAIEGELVMTDAQIFENARTIATTIGISVERKL